MSSFFTAFEQRSLSAGGVWDDEALIPWSEVCRRAQQAARRFPALAGKRVLVSCSTAAGYATAFCTTALLGCETWLRRPDLPPPAGMARLSVCGERFDVVYGGEPDFHVVSPGGFVVYTSGTTATPRACLWEFQKLEEIARSVSGRNMPWLSAYPPFAFAGLYTIVSAVIGAGSLFLIGNETVECSRWPATQNFLVCGTPTFWRRLLLLSPPAALARLRPGIVSLGGEIASQEILDKLAHAFPGARLVHVYATTELGSLFSVSDGQSGFPSDFLGRRLGSGATLEIADGELVVLRADRRRMHTGDAVHIHNDRILFDGRADGVINVAGSKVRGHHVEEVIRKLPFVIDVRVLPHPSPLTGSIVSAEIVIDSSVDAASARADIRLLCDASLDRPSQPRRISIVDHLSTTATGKVLRAVPT